MFDPHRYTRNLVDTGNGKYNLMILCWGPSMASCVHDHSDAHCFVKILQGQVCPTVIGTFKQSVVGRDTFRLACYDGTRKRQRRRRSQADGREGAHSLRTRRSNVHQRSENMAYVSCMRNVRADSIGLHRMENMSHTEPAVSLHVYIPAFQKCRTFDARTSKPTTVGGQVQYHSTTVL